MSRPGFEPGKLDRSATTLHSFLFTISRDGSSHITYLSSLVLCSRTYINGHGNILFLGIMVVLVYIEHDDGICQGKSSVVIDEEQIVAFLRERKLSFIL